MPPQRELQAVIVDDHAIVRRGVEVTLQNEGIRVIGIEETPAAGARTILARKPDVAVVDIGLHGGSGLDLTRAVIAEDPTAAILLYTGGGDKPLLRDALDSGARGFALKAGGTAELVAAVRAVAAGGEYVDPRVARLLDAPDEPGTGTISPREREVLDLLAEGLGTEEIGERLFLSPQTVQTHVRNLMRKLGAHTRVHALALAIRLREIELG